MPGSNPISFLWAGSGPAAPTCGPGFSRWQQHGWRERRGLGGSGAGPGCLLLYIPADSGTVVRRAPAAPFTVRSADLTEGSYDDILNAEQLEKLLYLLESTKDPLITEKALVTLGNNAAFSANQAIIRELGGIPIVGNKINSLNQSIKEKALNALNNLSVNVENQTKIKIYVRQVCEDVFADPLNSAVQLAGLRLLTNMTVTNDYQHLLIRDITGLLHRLLIRNGSTKVQVLKLLLNLSENPAMTEGRLRAQVDSSFLSLYDGQMANDILLRALTLFQNINNCLQVEGRLAAELPFAKSSLFFLLYGEECAQKMKALACHHDADVKEKALAIKPKF